MILAAALLARLAAAQTADLPPHSPRERADEAVAILNRGDWNARVHATHELGKLGVDGLPGLRVAAEDADWQVRMTAAHLLGRAGAPAAPDLARLLEQEPCRLVRLTALHWLGAIGTPEASEALRRGLDDESGMVRLMGRYWLRKEGGPSKSIDDDAAAASREDLKHCESSPEPGRAPWIGTPRAGEKSGAEIVDEPVVTPDPAPRAKPAPPNPEALPGAPPLPPRPERDRGEARVEPVDRARLDELDALLAPDEKEAEALPPSPAAPPARPSPEPPGEIMPDAGTGKPAVDPLPALKRLLVDADPQKRARAADELGRLGPAAPSAEPALAAALKDRDRRVRASAALALGNLGAAADPAVPALVAALKRGPEEVEWSAAVALGRIGTPRARRAFARYARQSAGDFLKREDLENGQSPR